MKEDKYLLVYDLGELSIYRFLKFVPYKLDTYCYSLCSRWITRDLEELELPLLGEQHPLIPDYVFDRAAELINDCFCSIKTLLITEPRIPETTFNVGDCYISYSLENQEWELARIEEICDKKHPAILFTIIDTWIHVRDGFSIREEDVVKWKKYYHVSSSCFEKIESLFYSTRDSVYELFEPYVSLSEEDWTELRAKCVYEKRDTTPYPFDY